MQHDRRHHGEGKQHEEGAGHGGDGLDVTWLRTQLTIIAKYVNYIAQHYDRDFCYDDSVMSHDRKYDMMT